MPKIYLSPSDQDRNTYAYGNTNEAEQCEAIADLCRKALQRCGFDVRVAKRGNAMENRVVESNNWGADAHIPIHTNAFNGTVSGTRVFYYSDAGDGCKLSHAIYDVLAPLTPGTSDNINAYPALYELRKTDATAAYVECDFHDNPTSAKWIVEHKSDIAEAICKGCCNYYGVTYKTPTEAAAPSDGVLYRVQVGAFAVRANAEAMLAKLKAAGFDGFITTVKK